MENEIEIVKSKICTKCHLLKPLTEFYKQSQNKKDGLAYICKSCSDKCRAIHKKENKEREAKRQKEYRIKNKEELCANERQWYKDNKKHVLEVKKIYRRKRRAEDPLFRIRSAISRRINYVLRGSKSKKSLEILGCDLDFLKKHLESMFQPGMSWENYGVHGWHIDHKIPLASVKTAEEIEKLCHYTNLQPLWALDNIRKSNKIT